MSITWDECYRIKQSVVLCRSDDSIPDAADGLTQWSADNVDHNTITPDGQGSIHGVGIISMSTPYTSGQGVASLVNVLCLDCSV